MWTVIVDSPKRGWHNYTQAFLSHGLMLRGLWIILDDSFKRSQLILKYLHYNGLMAGGVYTILVDFFEKGQLLHESTLISQVSNIVLTCTRPNLLGCDERIRETSCPNMSDTRHTLPHTHTFMKKTSLCQYNGMEFED